MKKRNTFITLNLYQITQDRVINQLIKNKIVF